MTIRALHLVAARSPLIEVELDDPRPAPDEVVIRIEAAGICRSDLHYRSGSPKLPPLPRVLGHEIAGVVTEIGTAAGGTFRLGDRVGVQYQVSCGRCLRCRRGQEQHCFDGAMIGNHRNGGYAEAVAVPVRNLVAIPDAVSMLHAAVMMCSTATVFHALRRTRMAPGDRVAVFGLGGLGASAVQLALALGAAEVFAVDVNPTKTAAAGRWGATGIDASVQDPVAAIRDKGDGVDVALELVGLRTTFEQAVAVLGPGGRAGVVGLSSGPATVHPYADIVGRELEIVGVMDHLGSELPEVLALAERGTLDLTDVITGQVPLDAAAVNGVLDDLAVFGDAIRTVIVPNPG